MTGLKNIWHSRTQLTFFMLVLFSACPKDEPKQQTTNGPPRVVLENSAGRQITVEVELARTEAQKRQGLMHRQQLPENRGMLFIFAYESRQAFWMKNTLIPLDLIFIGQDFIIKGIIENAKPESERILRISEPSRYVLEVNAGFAQRNGIRAGDRVGFLGFEVE